MILDSDILKKLTKNVERSVIKIVKQEKAHYFYRKPIEKRDFVNSRLLQTIDCFLETLNISEFKPVNFQSIKPFYCFGMISSSTGSKLDTEDVFIFNTIDGSNIPVKLDLSAVDQYSLFNGQIVALKGTNSRGDSILVEKIYTETIFSISASTKGNLNAVLCRGPYSIEYLNRLFELDSDVFILLGPFCGTSESEFTEFGLFISSIENNLMKRPKVKTILVPSLDDYSAVRIFPQPPLKIDSSNIITLQNPGVFYLNENLISVCNFDNFLDLCSEEIASESLNTSDRVERLVKHLVFQRCFVPVLFSKLEVAYGPWLNIKHSPDIYIIASKMKQFERKVGPITVLNTGTAARTCIKIESDEKSQYKIERLQL